MSLDVFDKLLHSEVDLLELQLNLEDLFTEKRNNAVNAGERKEAWSDDRKRSSPTSTNQPTFNITDGKLPRSTLHNAQDGYHAHGMVQNIADRKDTKLTAYQALPKDDMKIPAFALSSENVVAGWPGGFQRPSTLSGSVEGEVVHLDHSARSHPLGQMNMVQNAHPPSETKKISNISSPETRTTPSFRNQPMFNDVAVSSDFSRNGIIPNVIHSLSDISPEAANIHPLDIHGNNQFRNHGLFQENETPDSDKSFELGADVFLPPNVTGAELNASYSFQKRLVQSSKDQPLTSHHTAFPAPNNDTQPYAISSTPRNLSSEPRYPHIRSTEDSLNIKPRHIPKVFNEGVTNSQEKLYRNNMLQGTTANGPPNRIGNTSLERSSTGVQPFVVDSEDLKRGKVLTQVYIEKFLLEAHERLEALCENRADENANYKLVEKILEVNDPGFVRYQVLQITDLLQQNNNSSSRSLLPMALHTLERYGQNLLKHIAARPVTWRLIKFSSDAFQTSLAPINGALSNLSLLGYCKMAKDSSGSVFGVEFVPERFDHVRVRKLTADFVIAKYEVEAFVNRSHPHMDSLRFLLQDISENRPRHVLDDMKDSFDRLNIEKIKSTRENSIGTQIDGLATTAINSQQRPEELLPGYQVSENTNNIQLTGIPYKNRQVDQTSYNLHSRPGGTTWVLHGNVSSPGNAEILHNQSRKEVPKPKPMSKTVEQAREEILSQFDTNSVTQHSHLQHPRMNFVTQPESVGMENMLSNQRRLHIQGNHISQQQLPPYMVPSHGKVPFSIPSLSSTEMSTPSRPKPGMPQHQSAMAEFSREMAYSPRPQSTMAEFSREMAYSPRPQSTALAGIMQTPNMMPSSYNFSPEQLVRPRTSEYSPGVFKPPSYLNEAESALWLQNVSMDETRKPPINMMSSAQFAVPNDVVSTITLPSIYQAPAQSVAEKTPKKEGDEWSCRHCTFLNPPDTHVCQICYKTSWVKPDEEQKPKEPTDMIIPLNQLRYAIFYGPKDSEGGQQSPENGVPSERKYPVIVSWVNEHPMIKLVTRTEAERYPQYQKNPPIMIQSVHRPYGTDNNSPMRIPNEAVPSDPSPGHKVTPVGTYQDIPVIRSTHSQGSFPSGYGMVVESPHPRESESKRRLSMGAAVPPQEDTFRQSLQKKKENTEADAKKRKAEIELLRKDGEEVVANLREAELQGFSVEHYITCLDYCPNDPLNFLSEVWPDLISEAMDNFPEQDESLGVLSRKEAEEASLAVPGLVDSAIEWARDARQRRINEVDPDEYYSREEVVEAIFKAEGNVEDALILLERKSLTPFLDRMWMDDLSLVETFHDRLRNKELDVEMRTRLIIAERVTSLGRAETALKLIDQTDNSVEDCIEAAVACGHITVAKRYLNHECAACFTPLSMRHLTTNLNCQCLLCYECLRDYLTITIKEKHIRHLTCPICQLPDTSDEPVMMEYFNNIGVLIRTFVKRRLMDASTYEVFETKLRDLTLKKDPKFRWCAHCPENGFIWDDPRSIKMDCHKCSLSTCFLCHEKWLPQHRGISCEQFREWKEANDPEYLQQQAATLASQLARHGIRCPECNFTYDLARGGCMHFRCSQCGYEFCSGCSSAFRNGAQCNVHESCQFKGLHAHHPRDCLYHMRDRSIEEIKTLLDNNNIEYDTEEPEQNDGSHICHVMEQHETENGLKDEECGADSQQGNAGLCEKHYKEYLIKLANDNAVDPVVLMNTQDIQAVLRRSFVECPPSLSNESEGAYLDRLKEFVKLKLPLPTQRIHQAKRPDVEQRVEVVDLEENADSDSDDSVHLGGSVYILAD